LNETAAYEQIRALGKSRLPSFMEDGPLMISERAIRRSPALVVVA